MGPETGGRVIVSASSRCWVRSRCSRCSVSSASGQTVRAGNLIVTVEGGFTPHKLPKADPGSITLSARSTIATADGTHLPALDFLQLEFDKHTGVYTKGLAACSTAKLENTLTSQAKQLCPEAIIGSGQAGAEIAFPEQAPPSSPRRRW